MSKILDISTWILLLGGIVALLGFSNSTKQKQSCAGFEINVLDVEKARFITAADVQSLLSKLGYSEEQQLKSIDIGQLEKVLINNSSIKQADVYTTIDGKVVITIKQRTPILRIFNSFGESFYIDEQGSFMPLSNRFTARVMLAHGNIDLPFSTVFRLEDLENDLRRIHRKRNSSAVENTDLFDRLKISETELPGASQLRDLFRLAEFVNNSDFWRAQVSQVYIDENKDLIITPRVGNHEIVFGEVRNIKEKFNKLMLFYQKGLNRTGWNEYESINLKYKNQVVCTKR